MNKSILDFCFKAMDLKLVNISGWEEVGIINVESVMDHVGSTVMLAMAINSEKGLNLNMSKVYEMIVIKELKKAVSKNEVSITENSSNTDDSLEVLKLLSNNSSLIDTYNEYKEGVTKEAKFALMVSKFESDIQAKKYEMNGEFTIENAKRDIENYPEELRSQLTNITKASDGWLAYDSQFYDEMFKKMSEELKRL